MDFVEDWVITQTLGEGAYGEVKLVVNKITSENVAMKLIHTGKNPEVDREVKKEIAIHKILRHPNIIRFYGSRTHSGIDYIFLEYAPHGELFDRIEPDVGMGSRDARKYMLQLLKGVEYLHRKGIAHRDIKPENLLLDENDNLKISDFGLATVFRSQGKERPLDKKCGTLPYVAPEVLQRPYAAQPADIWSCGIVLVAMLAGELPWDKAEKECPSYEAWLKGEYALSPWFKLDTVQLSLVFKILKHVPSERYTATDIMNHRWFTTRSSRGDSDKTVKKMKREIDSCDGSVEEHVSLSQNLPTTEQLGGADTNGFVMFLSQPTSMQDMLLSTQLLNTQSNSGQNCMQKLVRRMTRFVVDLNCKNAVDTVTEVLSSLGLSWVLNTPNHITVTTMDKRKSQLIFKANVIESTNGTLLDFRLSRGCGLEFKKYFVSIRALMKDHIAYSNAVTV